MPDPLYAVSPLDGRYADRTAPLAYGASGLVREAYRPSIGETARGESVMADSATGGGKSVSERHRTPMHIRRGYGARLQGSMLVRAYIGGSNRNY